MHDKSIPCFWDDDQALRASWAARDRGHALALAALEEELQTEEDGLATRIAAAVDLSVDRSAAAVGEKACSDGGSEAGGRAPETERPKQSTQQTKKKTGKHKAARPAPEMIAFLRSKRERLKALKGAHADAVAKAVAQLGPLELDALEDMGLI